MIASDFDKAALVLFLWQQDRSRGIRGLTCIGCVIRNRVLAGWHGGLWLPVIQQEMKGPVTLPDPSDPLFNKLLWIVEDIYTGRIDMSPNQVTGKREDMTGNALYFADLGKPVPDTFRESILAKPEIHPRTATVETLHFFA